MITVIDYGINNVGSIVNMLKRIKIPVNVVNEAKALKQAKKIILPGIGAFDAGMQSLISSGIKSVLEEKVLIDKVPILGICLGMQFLTIGSEEGDLPGFGWIKAETKKFNLTPAYKVPHMGWNIVKKMKQHRLIDNLEENSRFYFVHSYAVEVESQEDLLLQTEYGYLFESGIYTDNIYGLQFHPEKSHKFGMQILKNFSAL